MSKKDKKNKKKHADESRKQDKILTPPGNGTQHVVESVPPEGQIPINKKAYEKELAHLLVELVKLQEWVRYRNLKVVVIFEGRDAAGKGGVIKRITERLNPRVCRAVPLAAPTEREKRQGDFHHL